LRANNMERTRPRKRKFDKAQGKACEQQFASGSQGGCVSRFQTEAVEATGYFPNAATNLFPKWRTIAIPWLPNGRLRSRLQAPNVTSKQLREANRE
jgi:hypothetical protein